ncbi:hypothetical protein JTB14_015033 [Gonioctena quinquepunctata]|nr:hypothetical protein JTB14_015033 [Gonioctena quinquepunctata]
MMYILVRFNCDGIFHVNVNSRVKIQKKKIRTRYGRYWYEADIRCKNLAKEGTSHEEELRISNYMSHKYSIHKAVYDQSTHLLDITTVCQRLERCARKKRKSSEARVRNKNIGERTAAEKQNEVESIALEKMK